MQKTLDIFGKQILRIGLGAMPLSLEGRPDESIASSVITAFIELGGNFIDTANVYCIDDTDVGHNEKLIAKNLTNLGKENDIIVTTKGGLRRPKGNWEVDASPEWLKQSCEKSLRDLDVECINLYQLHAPDPDIPLVDSVGALACLKEEGKIEHIGLSNVTTMQIETAQTVAEIFSVQNRCNLFERKSFENGVVEKCKQSNILFIPHSPVGGHHGHSHVVKSSQLNAVAQQYEMSPYQVMLAWLLKQGDHILPIPGASKESSIISSLTTLDYSLDIIDLAGLN